MHCPPTSASASISTADSFSIPHSKTANSPTGPAPTMATSAAISFDMPANLAAAAADGNRGSYSASVRRRRRSTPNPSSPVITSAAEAGSGTDGPLEIKVCSPSALSLKMSPGP